MAFNPTQVDSTNNPPSIEYRANDQGGVTLFVVHSGGDSRLLTINPGGGHWEIETHSSIPPEACIELGEDSYPIVHQN